MAVTITTAENSFSVDGVWYRKGALTFEEASEDRIVIRGYVYSASEVLCDGVSFATLPDLVTWLNASVFNAGGGNGDGVAGVQSVTGNLVSGTSDNPVVNLPVGSDRDVLTWDANGVSKAERINAWHLTDIGGRPSFPFGVLSGASLQTDNPILLFTEATAVPKSGKIPLYGTAGRLAVSDGVANSDAVNMGQLNLSIQNKQYKSEKGLANGYAPLDSAGLIPLEHLNISGLTFKGAWNAETNTPNLLNGEGNVGDFYKTGVAGEYNFGNGSYTFAEGDWVIFAAGVWQRLGSSDAVSMVNGRIGSVVINKSDIGLSNVNNTSDLDKPISTLTQNALNEKQDKLSSGSNIKTLNGQPILGSGDLVILSDSIINTSFTNNVRTNEYSDRFEYLAKFSINASVSGSGYLTNQTSVYFPTGKTIDGANEHYISIRNNERTVSVNIFDDTSTGRVSVGYRNSWTGTTNVQGTCFIKLVYYK